MRNFEVRKIFALTFVAILAILSMNVYADSPGSVPLKINIDNQSGTAVYFKSIDGKYVTANPDDSFVSNQSQSSITVTADKTILGGEEPFINIKFWANEKNPFVFNFTYSTKDEPTWYSPVAPHGGDTQPFVLSATYAGSGPNVNFNITITDKSAAK